MTLLELIIYVVIAAVVLTGIEKFTIPRHVNAIVTSFLQNFCGILFLFSGFVKVIDPLGTAFKMEDYFQQFFMTFEETWLSFLAPMFPFLSEYSIIFSLATIVLELVIGLFLILGHKPRWTSWAFLLIMIFFTALTGFTFLTGYVPVDSNFFSFSEWGTFKETNMRVTDCGCFGDFIILDPRVSFLKDVFLLIPALYFMFSTKTFHTLFSSTIRWILSVIFIIGMIIYGVSNYSWDLPDFDFRPFKEGNNLVEIKRLENAAQQNIEILSAIVRNKETGEILTVPYEQFIDEYPDNYPKEVYSVEGYNKTEPTRKLTKVSEFTVFDEEGNPHDDDIFEYEGYSFIVISYKPEGIVKETKVIESDSIFEEVPVMIENEETGVVDTTKMRRFVRVDTETSIQDRLHVTSEYRSQFEQKIVPFMSKAKEEGHRVMGLFGSIGFDDINYIKAELGMRFDVYEADNILLKTIIRSNPGILVLKNGVVVKKWHINKLLDFSHAKVELGI